MDDIANFLTRIRNAVRANPVLTSLEVKSSYVKKRITEILHEQGYIENYTFDETKKPQGTIKIQLKYHPKTKKPAIVEIVRISKPSKRIYVKAKKLVDLYNNLANNIVSTSQGVMIGKEAKRKGLGGELLCYVY